MPRLEALLRRVSDVDLHRHRDGAGGARSRGEPDKGAPAPLQRPSQGTTRNTPSSASPTRSSPASSRPATSSGTGRAISDRTATCAPCTPALELMHRIFPVRSCDYPPPPPTRSSSASNTRSGVARGPARDLPAATSTGATSTRRCASSRGTTPRSARELEGAHGKGRRRAALRGSRPLPRPAAGAADDAAAPEGDVRRRPSTAT